MGVFLGFFPLRPENGLIRGKMDRVGRIPPRQHPPASADAPHMCEQKTVDGRRKIIRKTGQKWPKWKKQAQGWPNFASGSLRGRPTHMWKGVDDGNSEITRKKKTKKWSKWQKQGRDWPNFSSASFRQLMQAPNTCVGRRWKEENYKESRTIMAQISETGAGLAEFRFRQLPRTPNTCLGGRRRVETGKLNCKYQK